jgi:hypothetical protein
VTDTEASKLTKAKYCTVLTAIAHELSKFSPNGQGRALRAINVEKLSYSALTQTRVFRRGFMICSNV